MYQPSASGASGWQSNSSAPKLPYASGENETRVGAILGLLWSSYRVKRSATCPEEACTGGAQLSARSWYRTPGDGKVWVVQVAPRSSLSRSCGAPEPHPTLSP